MREDQILEISIFRIIQLLVTRRTILQARLTRVRAVLATSAVMAFALSATPGQIPEVPPTLDLTAKAPTSEQGIGRLPGAAGGGGGSPTGTRGTPRYRLPLEIRILRSAITETGDFIIEVQLRNTGDIAFDLPASRDLTRVQRPGNKSQREFFFWVRPALNDQHEVVLGGAATGGSTSVPGSYIRLEPGVPLGVLLPAAGNLITRSIPKGAKQAEIRVVCGEWTLADDRYFIQSEADELPSTNSISLNFRNQKPTQP